jgi:hypothetical protein
LLTRRQFIQVGIAGAALLAAARYLDRPHSAPANSFRVLDDDAAGIVRAVIPVVLAGSLPADAAARARTVSDVVAAFDRAVSGLAPAVQEEVKQLFSLLGFAPSRIAFAWLWTPVSEASRGDLEAFLTRWRHSRFDLQRQSYEALTQLIQASWYGNPASWDAIGYSGPPAIAENAVVIR